MRDMASVAIVGRILTPDGRNGEVGFGY